MNTWISTATWGVISIVLLVKTAYAVDTIGTVKTVKGDVSIMRDDHPIKATVGSQLFAMDRITTGRDSSVGITLQDSTLLSFGSKSNSQLNEFQYDPVKRDGNLLISVFKGSMRFVTGLLGKLHPESVSIHLPSATLGIRGTDFIVSVEGGD